MRRLAFLILPLVPASLAASAAMAVADENSAKPNPHLDYVLDAYRDEQITFDSARPSPGGYSGRWTGTWHGADGRVFSGDYEGSFTGQAQGQMLGRRNDLPLSPRFVQRREPDPALYGSGLIVDGWYYPPPVVTETVIEYRPVR